MSEARIVTFGCRLNVYESEVMRGKIAESGLEDAIVFNTCAVTAEATRQARQAIRRARRWADAGLRDCGLRRGRGGSAVAAHRPARNGDTSRRRSLPRMARERRSRLDDRPVRIRIRRRVGREDSEHGIGRVMSVEVVTFGCRLNITESETIRRHAEAAKWTSTL